ncbi:cop-coated vesicle membrane protein p24 precursor [Trypanosoma rangeli]|uniref:Cop-coated vesicle membrane protein p24 n=1 Tax=Trypanosoma rangeli TaxID=5698 RepID=A0A422NFM3_TRYRA|nr:cop-coated vesicle membrane protein p24 precursor [Trypanosoma rangeli]RNF04263.1 cop-coated vesicle membrane protein p24 precursor [Trypanosoma rangeli]|eukprot:RNF04263.1 cop-coated vesicle membrane protein p24 precursor [Trypanosoma rangeli]
MTAVREGVLRFTRSSLFSHLVVLLALLASLNTVRAVRVRSTTQDLAFEVNREEVCMYSVGLDSNEGAALHYRVLRGGDDFDVYIRSPRNKTVYVSYAGEHELEDRVYFTKHLHGEYSYCIDNSQYSGSRKTVQMSIGVTSLKRWKDRIDPLTKSMLRTDSVMLGLHDDQIIFRLRERDLRDMIEESKKLLFLSGAAETAVIVILSFLYVILIKHLFSRTGTRAVA